MNIKAKSVRAAAVFLAVLMLLTSLMGCGAAPAPASEALSESRSESQSQLPVSTEPAVAEQWAEKMNLRKMESVSYTMLSDSFDERFLAYLSEHAEGNYMASPLSFRYALGLLLAGANGETKAELLHALGVESEEEWIESCLNFNGFAEFFASDLERERKEFQEGQKQGWIPADAAEPFRALRVANSVWKAERIGDEFTEAYKESVEKNYAAEYRSFTAENAVKKINEWAEIKTEHMIKQLLPEDYPTEMMAVVLMNALYFKDSWCFSFPELLTKEGVFHAQDGRKTRKEFMSEENDFSYYADEETELVIIPMKGGVNMAFVLGSTENLEAKIAKAVPEKVQVTIPKMDLETDFSSGELVAFLKEYGVSLAFDEDKADFSAMIDHFVEEGVEAAAVTAIVMEDKALPLPKEPVIFTADRPFSFYIYTTCNDTTAMMFAGEIVE